MQSFNFQSRKNPIRINKKVTAPRSEKSNIGDRPAVIGYYSESWDIGTWERSASNLGANYTHLQRLSPCAVRCSECDKTQMPIYLRRTVHHNSGQRACGPLPSSFRYRYSAINMDWRIHATCRRFLIAYILIRWRSHEIREIVVI